MTDTRWVLVCTDKRGVFAGRLLEQGADRIALADAQMCIHWSAETRGVLGLAATGPAGDSRVGPRVSRIELTGITAVVDMTDEAVERWRAQPWR